MAFSKGRRPRNCKGARPGRVAARIERVRASRSILVAGACLAGCSLLIDSGELVEGSSSVDGGAGSAGAAGSGGASGGGGVSGSGGSSDANVPDQSGGSAGSSPDADAGPEPFCANLVPAPTLCSDFDAQELPAGWSGLSLWGGCNAVVDSAVSTSTPRSVSFSSPTLADGEQCAAVLQTTLATPASSLVIEFDIYPEAFDASYWVALATVEMSSAAGDDILSLRMRAGQADVQETATLDDGGHAYEGHTLAEVPPVGQWSHVRWEITFGGTSAFSNVNVNGKSSGGSINANDFLGSPEVRVGIASILGAEAAQVIRYDNLVVDVK